MDISQIRLNHNGLRHHQIEAKVNIFKAWEVHDSVMLQMPTGTGKTYLFTSIINDIIESYKKQHLEINILVVAHRTELIDQISATLTRFNIPHGFIQGQREQNLWRRVQVGSIMSLLTEKNYLNTMRQQFDFIIVDEAHHSLADTYVQLFELFPKAKKLGVTATPWRFNHESFLKIYQVLVPSCQISWFIENGVLADFDYVSIRPDSQIQKMVDRSKVTSTGDFVNSDLDLTFNNMRIRSKLYDSYVKFANGRKGIIYAINRSHAVKIAELYSSHGVCAVAIDCETPKDERQYLIEKFKDGYIKVLVNVDIFTEGFDCPDVSFIQLARPTRSLALYLQQVGRGLRVSGGKEKTIIIDNVGLYNYFGLPDANRKWEYHFKGHEDVSTFINFPDSMKDVVSSESSLADESRFEEDNEQMEVIRSSGSVSISPSPSGNNDYDSCTQKLTPSPLIEELVVADYYLVRGNYLKFRIYPFSKKHGKRTDAVGACIYEFDIVKSPIVLWRNKTQHNEIAISKDTKLHTMLSFIAMLLKIDINLIYNTTQLSTLSKYRIGDSLSLFDLFKMLSLIH